MNLTFQEYQAQALTTAVYPRQYVLMSGEATRPDSPSCIYPVFGLCGEIGEVVQVATDKFGRRSDLIKECGDVLWYVAAICSDLCVGMNDIAGNDVFEDFQSGLRTINGVDDKVLIYELVIAAGIVAEATKKTIRDANGITTPERLAAIKAALKRALAALALLCWNENISFELVAQTNLNKLAARAAKGVIQGNGDNR